MQRTFKLCALVATMLTLTGCGTFQQMTGERDKPTRHDKVTAQAERLLGERDTASISHTAGQPVIYSNGVYVARNTIRRQEEITLPPLFYESVWFNTTVKDINEFAERITLRTKIPAVVGTDVMDAMIERTERMAEIAKNTASNAKFPPLPVGLPGVRPNIDSAGIAAAQMANAASSMLEMKINYSGGTLKALLDMVASRYGVSWKYQQGQIRFFMHDTRSFYVRAVPGSATATASVSSPGANAAGGGSAQQTTGMNSDLSVWDGMLKSVEAMLTEKGKVVVSPATSSLTVTDTPTVIERVAAFVDEQNSLMAKQVMVNVEVLTVMSDRGDNYSISWDLVYDTLLQRYGMKNTVTETAGAVAMSFGIVASNSKFSGTKAIVNALSEQGRVFTKHSASATALNNQPAPIQSGRQFGYVAESSRTVTELGETTTISQGTVNSGFSMQVLPSILPDGQVILQFAADITTLRELRPVTSGNVTIEAPDFDSKNFLQRVKMRSGETLVLAGYEADTESRRNSGVGSPFFPFLGGGVSGGVGRETTVVLITPVIVH